MSLTKALPMNSHNIQVYFYGELEKIIPDLPSYMFYFFIFFIWVLRPFQEYFTYIKLSVHQRWVKTGEPGERIAIIHFSQVSKKKTFLNFKFYACGKFGIHGWLAIYWILQNNGPQCIGSTVYSLLGLISQKHTYIILTPSIYLNRCVFIMIPGLC